MRTVHIANIKDYNEYIPELDIIKIYRDDDKTHYGKDICVISATINDKNYINIDTRNDLLSFTKGKYFRQTHNCKFKIEIKYI